ncbi:MAG: SulP family inorganic anion transporter [Planctomycetaceae bacterium]|jgi:sulfate permease, SulP family|nr:SulP family inorganic anion transporter [Planctomycetaceae bacterium]MBT6156202.1 SulP family inorganic anion transporter [Planctomycetaceae bacterium]MBT6487139.1 SulP family inorganic anion transporter [Planctomycetaceae bacterium]MBT6494750.1 SulP family inorganic anion transporter [Planctomycetaceae bacterium]
MLQFFSKHTASVKDDVLSGLTVALALVPEAVAFAFVAGIPPTVGLYSAFFIGLISSLTGGRPGMISGATGAMAVVIVSLVALHGIEYLFPAVILCGLLQITVGVLRLGKLIRLVPHPVMLGFVNGLAIVIGLAQIGSFKTLGTDGTMTFLQNIPLMIMFGLVALTMATIVLLPKLTKAVPSSLAAILMVSVIAVGINKFAPQNWIPSGQTNVVQTVDDLVMNNLRAKAVQTAATDAQSNGSSALSQDQINAAVGSVKSAEEPLPMLFFLDSRYVLAPLTWETLSIILPFSLILAGVGLIESLMTLTLIDEITETRGNGNRECIGQGAANIVCGLFGGMGGCAMIGQSLINVNSGGRGRLSGIVAAVGLMVMVVLLKPVISMVPIATLVGVMFMVVIGTFEWSTLHTWNKVPLSDVLVMVLVAGYTVLFHNLAIAVLLGIVVQALLFAWHHATHIMADIHFEDDKKVYQLHGPLFFASVSSFRELTDPTGDPPVVAIDFYFSRVYDQSAMEAISKLAERYRQEGKCLLLRNMNADCRRMIERAGSLAEVEISEDRHYHITKMI